MTERKRLKKELSKWKHHLRNLPRLIDCSEVYGDDYYRKSDIDYVKAVIVEIENKLFEIDKLNSESNVQECDASKA